MVCECARGRASARVVGEALGGPDARLSVRVEAPDVTLGAQSGLALRGDLSLAPREARAHLTMRSATGGALDFEGAMPFDWGGGFAPSVVPGPLALHARFDRLSLEPFTPVSPLVSREAGTLQGHVDVTGTAEDPEPRGELWLRDSTMVLPGLDQRVSNLDAHVSLAPDRILLHELRARDIDGRLAIAGHATFAGLDPVAAALRVDTKGFPLRQAGIVEAYVTSHARLQLARRGQALRGSVVFDRLEVELPEETPHDVQDLAENPDIVYVDSYPPGWSPPRPKDETSGAAPRAKTLAPDLLPIRFHVDASKPFWMRRDDFSVQLTAALDVVVTEEGAELTGEVRTLRGHIELLGTRFELAEGAIRFTGGKEVDPDLDVTAVVNEGTSNEVRVHLTGPLSEPKLHFADRNGTVMSPGTALRCITTSQCGATDRGAAGGQAAADAFTQQARSALASMTAGLLTAAVRHGLGANVPQISVTTGEHLEEVTVRAGFQANQLIPHALRKFITSLYIEGFVGTQADQNAVEASPTATRATGGFLIELRHPHRVVTRGRYQPPASWSLDVIWQR
jgi:translocation and assembly module TamB